MRTLGRFFIGAVIGAATVLLAIGAFLGTAWLMAWLTDNIDGRAIALFFLLAAAAIGGFWYAFAIRK